MMQRRHFLQKTLLALPIIFSGNLLTGCKTSLSNNHLPNDKITKNPNLLQNKLKEILPIWENKFNAKIGMTIIADSGEISSHRGDEYFPVNSTIKAFIASHILLLVDKGKLDLNEKIIIKESDLIEYSPVCKKYFNENKPISISELCEATITLSDNGSANILLDRAGGLTAFNQFLKEIGADMVLANNEPLLNRSHYGETSDTAKPIPYTRSLKALITDNILSNQSKEQLITWLINDKVADNLLRKYLPKNWRIGDKTGTGSESKNIIAVIWNENNKPYFISLFITQPHDGKSLGFKNQKDEIMAQIGKEIYPFL